MVDEIAPGRRAARARIKVMGPVMVMKRSRSVWGAFTRMALSVTIAWVRGLHRGVARDLEVADHLDLAVAGLGRPVGLAGEDGADRGLRVDGVALAALAPELAVGPG